MLSMSQLPWPPAPKGMEKPKPVTIVLEDELALEDGGWDCRLTHPNKTLPKGTSVTLTTLRLYGKLETQGCPTYRW